MTIKFDWDTEPLRFVTLLDQRKKAWTRSASGHPPHIRKRFVRSQTIKWIKWFKAASGITTLPEPTVSLSDPNAFSTPDADDVKIIFFPEAHSIPVATASTLAKPGKRRRKSLRRALYGLRRSENPRLIELKTSRGVEGPLHIGTRFDKAKVENIDDRALYLESLGIVVCPSLTKKEIATLEAEGATVLNNDIVEVIMPAPYETDAPTLNGNSGSAFPPWHLRHINVAAARRKKLTGQGVLIGVLDTGIDASHTEFKGKNVYFRAFDAVGGAMPSQKPRDFQYHGTHVCGLCAGANVGVAQGADLAVAAVLTEKTIKGGMSGRRAQILIGLNWLIQGGMGLPKPVDIVNASLGIKGVKDEYYEEVSAARLNGFLMCAAIGNNGASGIGNHARPGNYDCVFGVGAVDDADNVAAFSDWGPAAHPQGRPNATVDKPDIVAPGVKVVSALPDQKYGALDGTSMAAPIVTGAAALLIGHDSALCRDPDRLSQRLKDLTRPLPGRSPQSNGYRGGQGCLDLTSI